MSGRVCGGVPLFGLAMEVVRIGIVVCSDRASAGVYEDRGGPAVRAYLNDRIETPFEEEFAVVPDNRKQIEDKLIELCEKKCALVLTTGGGKRSVPLGHSASGLLVSVRGPDVHAADHRHARSARDWPIRHGLHARSDRGGV